MDKKKQMGVNSTSSSSLTMDLFGPKESSSSSSGLFGSVFGSPSTEEEIRGHQLKKHQEIPKFQGMRLDFSHTRPMSKKDFGNQYGNGIHGNPGSTTHNQNKSVEPCYFSSSIYYGGQEVYSPAGHTTTPQHNNKKDGGEDNANVSNFNGASRGNWWQGSLYY